MRGEGVAAMLGLLSIVAKGLANCEVNYSVRTAVHTGWRMRCSVAGTGDRSSCTIGALSAMELSTGRASVQKRLHLERSQNHMWDPSTGRLQRYT